MADEDTHPKEEAPAVASPEEAKATYPDGATTGGEAASTPKDDEGGDDPESYIDSLLEDDGDFVDTSEPETKETEEKPPEPAKEPAKTEEKLPEPGEEPKKEDAPKEEPKQPVQPAEPQSPSEAQAPQSSQEVSSEQYQKFFEDTAKVLEEKVYAIDPETAEKLDTEPSKVIPQLAARLHMQVLTAAVSQVATLMPAMFAQMQSRAASDREVEEKFYNDYPKLKGHDQTVREIGTVYRQLKPNATPEQFRQEVAAMAMVQLQIEPDRQSAEPAPVVPPRPASAGATGAPVQPKPGEPTTWDELINIEE